MALGRSQSSSIFALAPNYDLNLRNHFYACFLSQSSPEVMFHSFHHMQTFSWWGTTKKPKEKDDTPLCIFAISNLCYSFFQYE